MHCERIFIKGLLGSQQSQWEALGAKGYWHGKSQLKYLHIVYWELYHEFPEMGVEGMEEGSTACQEGRSDYERVAHCGRCCPPKELLEKCSHENLGHPTIMQLLSKWEAWEGRSEKQHQA